MPKHRIRRASSGVPLSVLKDREHKLEQIISRRKQLFGNAELPNAIPVHILEKRLHRLKAHILDRS
jgi:hypothetical protein